MNFTEAALRKLAIMMAAGIHYKDHAALVTATDHNGIEDMFTLDAIREEQFPNGVFRLISVSDPLQGEALENALRDMAVKREQAA